MNRIASLAGLGVAIAMSGALSAATPAVAGPAEVAYLQSYIGNWRGQGQLTGGDQNENFTCRVTVTQGNQGKINYAGRCAVAGLNLSVAGTIAYIDANNRYEAAMSSNATFSGVAIGRKQGDGVVFDLRERDRTEQGDMTITAQVSLGNGTIGLGFNYLMHDSGSTMNANVSFSRQ